jgi:DNA-binding MarR family transcriptional regulator
MISSSNDKQSYPIPVTSAPPKASEEAMTPRLPQELVKSTVFLLKRLGDAVREQAMPELVAAGCNPYHQAVLVLLAERARDTQAEIADALRVDRSQLVGILDDLEREGLIERHRDPNDRRRHVVSLTAEGKRTLTRRRLLVKRIENDFLEPLDAESRAKLHDLLLQLASHHDARYALEESQTGV